MFRVLKKEFLLGMGVGFIISAIMVSVFGPRELSDQEIRDRAAQMGMVEQAAPSGNTTGDNAGKGNVPTGSAGGGTVSKNTYSPNPNSGGTDKGGSQHAAGPPGDPDAVGKTASQQQREKPRSIIITITSGMGSESIARQLEEKGAVKDQYEFLKVVTAHRAHTRFQNGTFAIPAGTDMDEIVKILTGR